MTTTRFRTLPVVMWEQVRQVVDPTVAAVATVVLVSRPARWCSSSSPVAARRCGG